MLGILQLMKNMINKLLKTHPKDKLKNSHNQDKTISHYNNNNEQCHNKRTNKVMSYHSPPKQMKIKRVNRSISKPINRLVSTQLQLQMQMPHRQLSLCKLQHITHRSSSRSEMSWKKCIKIWIWVSWSSLNQSKMKTWVLIRC